MNPQTTIFTPSSLGASANPVTSKLMGWEQDWMETCRGTASDTLPEPHPGLPPPAPGPFTTATCVCRHGHLLPLTALSAWGRAGGRSGERRGFLFLEASLALNVTLSLEGNDTIKHKVTIPTTKRPWLAQCNRRRRSASLPGTAARSQPGRASVTWLGAGVRYILN